MSSVEMSDGEVEVSDIASSGASEEESETERLRGQLLQSCKPDKKTNAAEEMR